MVQYENMEIRSCDHLYSFKTFAGLLGRKVESAKMSYKQIVIHVFFFSELHRAMDKVVQKLWN